MHLEKNKVIQIFVYGCSHSDAKESTSSCKKVAYMKKMFRKYAKNIITSKSRNVFEIATELHNKGHRSLVVGSDELQSLIIY